MTKRRLFLTFVAVCFFAHPVKSQHSKHHIGIEGGYFRITNDKFENPFTGLSLRNNGIGGIHYRFTVGGVVDLVLQARQTFASDSFEVIYFPGYPASQLLDVQGKLSNTFLGAGFRLNAPVSHLRPYLQGNLYFVRQKLDTEKYNIVVKDDENTLGIGAAAGIEIFISRMISIPFEFYIANANFPEKYILLTDTNGYIVGYIPNAGIDISGFGISVGLTFNFGRMP
ncbi:MAG: outer membrane beta-barrel protein [candidate division Zixibacteria bacterium]|nr:outer membrane beta-barrel protein [candidate division Zixibacteria bacterium]MCI0595248.1 outer membrane beta-barrel protein [candidate division Zixibacteria bacterium]